VDGGGQGVGAGLADPAVDELGELDPFDPDHGQGRPLLGLADLGQGLAGGPGPLGDLARLAAGGGPEHAPDALGGQQGERPGERPGLVVGVGEDTGHGQGSGHGHLRCSS